MEAVIGQEGLSADFAGMPQDAQRLALDSWARIRTFLLRRGLRQGAWFLTFLEQRRFGRADFDAFLRGYFDHYAFQSIDTDTFATYTRRELLRHPG